MQILKTATDRKTLVVERKGVDTIITINHQFILDAQRFGETVGNAAIALNLDDIRLLRDELSQILGASVNC